MVDVHGPVKVPAAAALAGARVAGRCWWRPAGATGARHGVVAWASSFSSRIGLDSQVRWAPFPLLSVEHFVEHLGSGCRRVSGDSVVL
jgi:hypothetical protein